MPWTGHRVCQHQDHSPCPTTTPSRMALDSTGWPCCGNHDRFPSPHAGSLTAASWCDGVAVWGGKSRPVRASDDDGRHRRPIGQWNPRCGRKIDAPDQIRQDYLIRWRSLDPCPWARCMRYEYAHVPKLTLRVSMEPMLGKTPNSFIVPDRCP